MLTKLFSKKVESSTDEFKTIQVKSNGTFKFSGKEIYLDYRLGGEIISVEKTGLFSLDIYLDGEKIGWFDKLTLRVEREYYRFKIVR